MKTLGVTELVKTYESMDDALAYLNFSSVEEEKFNKGQVHKEEAPKEVHGYHGKPKTLQEKLNQITDKVEPPSKNKFGFFKKKD